MTIIGATFIQRLTSIRQLLMSRWECCLVAREHINRKALAAELAVFIMVSFYIVIFALFGICFSIISYLRFFDLISFDPASADVVLWGLCLCLMIILGLFSYAELRMPIKGRFFTISRVSFLINICFILIIYCTGYVLSPDVFYNFYDAGNALKLLTFLCVWMLYRLGFEYKISIHRFVSGKISTLKEAKIEAKAKARTLKYYMTIDLVFVAVLALLMFI